jgi:hypothetical protein
MKRFLAAVGAILAIAPGAEARNLCDILREKGVLNDIEYNECKAEQEKQEVQTEKKAQDVVATKWPKWLDMLTPFGDLRIRQEGFYEDGMIANNRFRLRARLGLNVAPSDEVAATFRLASGNPNDPISTNQTFTSEFTRKPFNLDWAYLTVKPSHSIGLDPGWFSLTGGKFGVPNYRVSELVWDDDLSPEGFNETVNFVEQKEGFLRGLRLNLSQWTVDQLSAAGDPFMFGGQIVADTAFGSTANWSAAFADYYYDDMNAVANTVLNPTNKSFNSALQNSNAVVVNNGSILAYAEGFNILNWSTDLDFANPFGVGIPGGLFGDFVYNTRADGRNVGFYVGAGIGKAQRDWYHDNLKNVGDWGLSYTNVWVEQNSTVSIFSYSDLAYVQQFQSPGRSQSGSTNIIASILRLDYLLFPNFQLTAKVHFINALDRSIAVVTPLGGSLVGNPTLVRTQLDATLRF